MVWFGPMGLPSFSLDTHSSLFRTLTSGHKLWCPLFGRASSEENSYALAHCAGPCLQFLFADISLHFPDLCFAFRLFGGCLLSLRPCGPAALHVVWGFLCCSLVLCFTRECLILQPIVPVYCSMFLRELIWRCPFSLGPEILTLLFSLSEGGWHFCFSL